MEKIDTSLISSPALPISFPCTLAIVFLETISFGAIQALIPLLPVLNQDPTDIVEDKYITNVPITFAIIEFGSIIVASIVCDLFVLRQNVAIFVTLLWAPASLLFYLTYSKTIFMDLMRFMAIAKGILQPLLLSIGTQDYEPEDYAQIYSYFMLNYCAYIGGVLGTYTIIRMDIVENSMCGKMHCLEIAIIVASGAAFLASVIFMLSITSYAKPKPTTFNFFTEILHIFETIFIYSPYTIFWIFYQRIGPQLTSLPTLINMYPFDGLDMPILFLEMKLMVAFIYYIFYAVFYRTVIKYSTFLMTIGGILVGIWPIIANFTVLAHQVQYSSAGPIKPDAIQLVYVCKGCGPVNIDIPYYKNPRCDMPGHSRTTFEKDQVLVLRPNNLCPYVIFDKNTINVCFQRGKSYVVLRCDNGAGSTFVDYGFRDTKGGAVVCVTLQNEKTCDANRENMAINIFRLPTAKTEFLSYTYILYSNNYSSTPPYNSICKTIEPGEYNISQDDLNVSSLYNFRAGEVFYLSTDTVNSVPATYKAVRPYKSTMWNTPIMGIYLLRAVGEFLLIVNGFYNVFIIFNQNLRTIAICLWLIQIKFGTMIYEIQYNNDIYFQHGDLNKLGIILIVMALLSYIMQEICCEYKTY